MRNGARVGWPRLAAAALNARDDLPARRVAATRRLHHRWNDLYELVLDIERYPAFVPGCRAVKVYSHAAAPAGRTVIVSRMTVGVAGFDVSYASRTTGDVVARRIEVEALDGPLRRLDALWTFEPNGEEWTSVGFSVDYAFDSAILSAVASRAFAAMFGEILAAFPAPRRPFVCPVMTRQGRNRRRRVAACAAVAAFLLCSLSAQAAPSTCPRELGATDITLIKSVLHLRGIERAPEDRQCAAYRQHVATVSKVREVFERCLSGAKRDADLQQLEGVLDDANGVIARVCDQ